MVIKDNVLKNPSNIMSVDRFVSWLSRTCVKYRRHRKGGNEPTRIDDTDIRGKGPSLASEITDRANRGETNESGSWAALLV